MKKLYTILLVAALLSLNLKTGFCTVHTIGTSGNTFSPDFVSAIVGDTIVFSITNSHNAVEVSLATWNANGITSNGGFSLPFGGGTTTVTQVKTYYYVCQAHVSSGMKGRISVTNTTGIISPAAAAQGLEIFPNPATSWITLKINLQAGKENSMRIFNLLGNCIYQKENIPSLDYINFTGIPSGVYFVEVRSEGAVARKKLVVER